MNYRSLQDGGLAVREHVVLVGPNASGKSSILFVAALVLGVGSELSKVSVQDFKDPTQPLVLDALLTNLDEVDRGAFPDEVEVEGGTTTLRVRVQAEVDPADPDTTLAVTRFFPDAGHSRRPSSVQVARLGFLQLAASRSMGRELAGAQGVARTLVRNLDVSGDAEGLEAGLAQVRAVLAGSGVIGGFREQLADRLSESLPTPVTKNDVKLVLSSDLSDSPLAGTIMTLRDMSGDRALTEHSDGVQALAVTALMGMDAQRTGRIVAVDEPETHLHPTAQRALVQRLLKGTAQQLMATHSSAVAAAAQPQQLATIDRSGVVRQLPEGAPVSGALQLLRDYRQGLVEPLTSRLVVIVEGDADRITVEAIARAGGIDLARMDVALFQLDGSGGFSSAWNFFGSPGLGMHVRAICDEDAREDWAGALGVSPGDLAASGVLVLNPDLEAVYVDQLGHERVVQLVQSAGLITERKFCGKISATTFAEVDRDDVVTACRANKTAAAASLAVGLTEADTQQLRTLLDFLAGLAS